MKKNLYMVFILTLVCFLCGLSLSWVFSIAQAKIKANEQESILQGLEQIVPNLKSFQKVVAQEEEFYKLYNQKNELLGYSIFAQGQGYQGKIKLLVVLDKQLEKILGIEIIDSQETPGLGERIREEQFKGQFKNKSASKTVECVKTNPQGNEIQAITGATISSRAVVKIVNTAIEKLKKCFK